MIRDAGFDGAGVRFFDYKYAKEVTDFLRAHNMTWQAQCYPKTVDDLKPILEHVKELGADHLNLQPDVRPYRLEECVPYIDGWRRLAHDACIPLHIETHRDRMTTDLFFTQHLLDCFPDLRLTADISHYVVGRARLAHYRKRITRRCIASWITRGDSTGVWLAAAGPDPDQLPAPEGHRQPVHGLVGVRSRSWRRRARKTRHLPVRAGTEGMRDDRTGRLRAVGPLAGSADDEGHDPRPVEEARG
jgi:hypothetical protein